MIMYIHDIVICFNGNYRVIDDSLVMFTRIYNLSAFQIEHMPYIPHDLVLLAREVQDHLSGHFDIFWLLRTADPDTNLVS